MIGSEPKNCLAHATEPVDLQLTQLLRSAKIRDCHLVLLAIVYVRQSTPYQVHGDHLVTIGSTPWPISPLPWDGFEIESS